jgi:ribosomal protein L7Ae-like RNA K-turn-binding protein
MKPSQTLSELEIVIKAIRSGNASAVIASNTIEPINQHLLKQLAAEHHCDVFFVAGKQQPFH